MKKILTAIMVLLFTITAVSAKNTEALTSLKSELQSYKEATMNQNIDKMVNFVYPAQFKIMPKAQMENSLKQMKMMQMMPKTNVIETKKINPIQKFSKGYFTTVDYYIDLDMNLKLMSPQIQQQIVNSIKAKSKASDKITFDSNTGILNIKSNKQLIAIKEGNNSWKFLEDTQVVQLAQQKLIPDEILKNIKN